VSDVSRELARGLIEKYHYAKGVSKVSVYVHGLFEKSTNKLFGVVWWLPPIKQAALSVSDDWRKVLSLSRMVMIPEALRNSCSFLLSRSVKVIRKDGRFNCLLTYADEAEGHTGLVYRACNWKYLGKTKIKSRWIDSDGKLVSQKAGPKNRTYLEMIVLGYKERKSCKHKYVLHL
jgi:hypothetical protein